MEAILATDISGGISREGKIPWKSKKDMAFFLQKTKNNVVIMGKNTFLSLPENSKPLKNRLNIVLTRDPYYYINNPEYMQHPNLIFTDDENIHNYIQQNREKIYEIYSEIKGFGYTKDPIIKEILENRNTKNIPTQKIGTDKPKTEITFAILLKTFFLVFADEYPRKSAIGSENANEIKESGIVI